MVIALEPMIAWVSNLIWVLVRVGGFLMVVPVLGNQLVSPRVRIAMAFAISVALVPVIGPFPEIEALSVEALLLVAWQLLIGIGLGFSTMVFFQLFVVAGQFIGMQMGLGFAALVDPSNGVSVTVVSQFFLMLVSLTFIAMNGHLVLLEVLVEGFKQFPVGMGVELDEMAHEIVSLGAWMFAGGVLIALPAVVALLVVNLSFGVMTRAAPQLNVFSLGFPFTLVFGLFILWVVVQGWVPRFEALTETFFEFARLWGV